MDIDTAIDRLLRSNDCERFPVDCPSEETIAECERRLGRSLHPDHRTLLLKAGNVFHAPVEIAVPRKESEDSYGDLVLLDREAHEDGVPAEFTIVSFDNGEHHCIDRSGRMTAFDVRGEIVETWDSLGDWVVRCWMGEDG